jgi:hypothetical protein
MRFDLINTLKVFPKKLTIISELVGSLYTDAPGILV